MSIPPDDRCRFTYPEDNDVGDDLSHQSCCWRSTIDGSEKCVWHADPDRVDKTVEALQEARVDQEIREYTSPVGEILDNVDLSDVELPDDIRLNNVSLREANFCKSNITGVNFSSSDLTAADFSHSKLPGAELVDAKLTGANFSEAALGDRGIGSDADALPMDFADIIPDTYIGGARLKRSELKNADFTDAYMINTDLSRSEIENADFQGAELQGADFTGSYNIEGANFCNADLFGAKFPSSSLGGVDFSNSRLIDADFRESSLTECNFSAADCISADFSDSSLFDTNFTDANCTNAKYSRANISGIVFTNAVLKGGDLSGAGISIMPEAGFKPNESKAVNLTNSDMRNCDVSDANIPEGDLTQVNAEGADFTGADLSEVHLTAADCEDSVFKEANLIRASLENADLVGADLTRAHLFGIQADGARIDTQTKLVENGPIGELTVDARCRYDTDALPDGPNNSLAMSEDELKESDNPPREIQLKHALNTYLQLEELARQNGLLSLQSEMFKRRQEMRRKLLKEKSEYTKWLFTEVQRWLFVYGESFRRVFGISVGIVALFWLLFLTTGTVETAGGDPVTIVTVEDNPWLLWDTFYHSISVFFTGTGPLTTTGRAGQVLTAIERIAGPILLALLIFVLGRRAAR